MTKNYLPQMSDAELEINTCVDPELSNGQHLTHGPVIPSEFSVCLEPCQELYIHLTSLQVEMIEDQCKNSACGDRVLKGKNKIWIKAHRAPKHFLETCFLLK